MSTALLIVQIPQWIAARGAVVPDRGRADAGLRRHGFHQPRPWRPVHARRLFGGGVLRTDRQFSWRRCRWHCLPLSPSDCCWNSWCSGISMSADHLDQLIATFGIILFLNHRRQDRLGCRTVCRCRSDRGPVVRRHRADARTALSGLAAGHYRIGFCGRRRTLRAGDVYPHRHAGSRRRHQCPLGVGAGRQYRTPVHDRVRFSAPCWLALPAL